MANNDSITEVRNIGSDYLFPKTRIVKKKKKRPEEEEESQQKERESSKSLEERRQGIDIEA